MKLHINGTDLECTQGDITCQKGFDAVVNAANAELLPGGGVAGAIHRTAGEKLKEACRPLAPISTAEAVITRGFELQNDYVIHVLGPVYSRSDNPEEELADCYINVLQLAEKEGLHSIAFPAISTGAFGFPVEKAAQTALKTLSEECLSLSSVDKIRMVLYDKETLNLHIEVMEELAR